MLIENCQARWYFHSQLGSLSTSDFETQTATASELFALSTCPHTTTFTLVSIFCPLEMSSIKIWEPIRSQHAKHSLPVADRVSKTCVLKLPNMYSSPQRQRLFWSAPRIATSGKVQHRKSTFTDFPVLCACSFKTDNLIGWEYEMNSLRMFWKLDLPRGRDDWCGAKRVPPLGDAFLLCF